MNIIRISASRVIAFSTVVDVEIRGTYLYINKERFGLKEKYYSKDGADRLISGIVQYLLTPDAYDFIYDISEAIE